MVSFTHDLELPWLLPGVGPTHRRATVQVIAIVGFERGVSARSGSTGTTPRCRHSSGIAPPGGYGHD